MPEGRRGTVGLFVVAVVVVTMAVLPASASTATKTSICNPGCDARAVFKPKTKHDGKREALIVRDLEADGHSAVAYIQIFDRGFDEWLGLGKAVYFNSNGANARAKRVTIKVTDGRAIRFQACVGDRDEDTFFDCGPFRRARS